MRIWRNEFGRLLIMRPGTTLFRRSSVWFSRFLQRNQRNPGTRPIPTGTLFTTRIIQMDLANLPGRKPSAHLLTKKTGTSSGETCAFTRFTECRCSERLRRDALPLVLDAQKRVPPVHDHVARRKCNMIKRHSLTPSFE